MYTRWNNIDVDDDVPFGMPPADGPEGYELIGVKTPLGFGRMHWTSSGKAWVTGEDFDLPLTHFVPSTLYPVFGKTGGAAPAKGASGRQVMRTLELREDDRARYAPSDLLNRNTPPGASPRDVLRDLFYRNTPPGLPSRKLVHQQPLPAAAMTQGNPGPDQDWLPDRATQPYSAPEPTSERSSTPPFDQRPAAGTDAAIQRIAFNSGLSGQAYGPSSSRLQPPSGNSPARPRKPELVQFPTPGTDHKKTPEDDPLAATRKKRGPVEEPPRPPQGYKGFNTPAGWGSLQRNADGTVSVQVSGQAWQVAVIPGQDTPAELHTPGSPVPKPPGGAPGSEVKRIPLAPIAVTNPGAKFKTFEEAAADVHRQVDQRSIDDNQEIHWHYYIDISTGLWGYTDPFGSGPQGGDKADFPVPTTANGRYISNVAVLGGGHTHGNYGYVSPHLKTKDARPKFVVTPEAFDAMNSNNWSKPDLKPMPNRKGFYSLGTPSRRNRYYDPIRGDRQWAQ